MKSKILSAALVVSAALLSSCAYDSSSNSNTNNNSCSYSCQRAPIVDGYVNVELTPWRGRFDSVRLNLHKDDIQVVPRESILMRDPDQGSYSFSAIPEGEWAVVAVYYKTNWDSSVTPARIISTAHVAAVDADDITIDYDSNCGCYSLSNAELDLTLKF
jgi:hypothetical protein